MTVVSPLKHAVRSDDLVEGLGIMSGVEGDKAHAVINAIADLRNELILDLSVMHMSPPHKHVGGVEHLIGKSLIGIVKRCVADNEIFAGLESLTDRYMDTVGIDRLNSFVMLFMTEFIPNSYIYHFMYLFFYSDHKRASVLSVYHIYAWQVKCQYVFIVL